VPDVLDPLSQKRAFAARHLQEVLKQGGTVLIVGARSANFPDQYRRHPRITVWDALEEHDNDRPPENTRAIICLRYISHLLYGRLNRFAKTRQAYLVALQTTADIKVVLTTALDIRPDTEAQEVIDASQSPAPEAAPETTTMTTPEPLSSPEMPSAETGPDAPPAPDTSASTEGSDMALRSWERGEMRTFLHAEMNPNPESIAEEARRLTDLARKKRGVKTTANSVAQAMYGLRNEAAKNGSKKHAPPKTMKQALRQQARRVNEPEGDDTMVALKIITDITVQLDSLKDIVLKLQQDQKKIAGLREYLGKL